MTTNISLQSRADLRITVSVITESDMKAGFMAQQDLMIISLESWKQVVDAQTLWLSTVPSTLIIKP